MNKTLIKLALTALPVMALAACGEEPAPAPEPTETVAPEPVVSLPPVDESLFSSIMADACPSIEPVNMSICSRGMGADTVSCEFSLGDDEYLRNDAVLEANEAGDGWVLSDAEALCADLAD